MCNLVLDKFSHRINYLILAVTICLVAPFDYILATQQDDTRLDWNTLSQILDFNFNSDGETVAIIVDKSAIMQFYLPIKTSTHAHAFPKSSNFEQEIETLSHLYQKIYILDWLVASEAYAPYNQEDFRLIWRWPTVLQEDDGQHCGRLIPFPTSFAKKNYTVSLYEYVLPSDTCSAEKCDWLSHDVYDWENDFRWLASNGSGFTTKLHPENNQMIITLGPLSKPVELNGEEKKIAVFINEQKIGEFQLNNQQKNGSQIIIDFPNTLLTTSLNTIQFLGDVWSPIDFGSQDPRTMLFAIKKIEFRKKDSP